MPWLAISAVAAILGSRTLIHEWSRGWLNVHFGVSFTFILGSAAIALYLGWKALIAYGVVPLVVVWRGRGEVWVGSAMARLGLSRRRLRVRGWDIRVELLAAPRPREASGQIFYPRVTSGGASLDLRSHGAVDPQELQEFLVGCADAFGGLPTSPGRDLSQ